MWQSINLSLKLISVQHVQMGLTHSRGRPHERRRKHGSDGEGYMEDPWLLKQELGIP